MTPEHIYIALNCGRVKYFLCITSILLRYSSKFVTSLYKNALTEVHPTHTVCRVYLVGMG